MIRDRQREIRPEQWHSGGLLNASKEARLTGMMLWSMVDDVGRLEVRANMIAGTAYPGDPSMTPETIESHLLELDESGFLTLYEARGVLWLELFDPLKTPRPKTSEAPDPGDPEVSGSFLPKERGRVSAEARAREWIAHEEAERAQAWSGWDAGQRAVPVRPERPLILDAPSIGCPEHPNGSFESCGPCGTRRQQREKWLAQERYARQMAEFYEGQGDADHA